MQPDARRARTAVERERHRPVGGVRVVQRVGGQEHLGLRLVPVELAVGEHLLPQHDPPGRRGVLQLPPVDRQRRAGSSPDRRWARARTGFFGSGAAASDVDSVLSSFAMSSTLNQAFNH